MNAQKIKEILESERFMSNLIAELKKFGDIRHEAEMRAINMGRRLKRSAWDELLEDNESLVDQDNFKKLYIDTINRSCDRSARVRAFITEIGNKVLLKTLLQLEKDKETIEEERAVVVE